MGLWDEILSPRTAAQSAWVWKNDRYVQENFGQGFEDARHVTAALRSRGVAPGDVVGAILTNSAAAANGFLGSWWAGAAVASLPIIARGQALPDYIAQLERLCASVGTRYLLIEERFGSILRDQGFGPEPEIVYYETLAEHPNRGEINPPEEDEVMFIQFSSGTTSSPRGVELTGRAIDAQLRLLAERASIDPDHDVGVMWLPLSHDMGFFAGNILVWYTGMHGVMSSPERFLAQPWTWFEDCARFDATITIGPSFAYHVAGRTRRGRSSPGPLSLRLCIVGGEQVLSSHLRSCTEAFASEGLALSAFTPAYGLAEATLGVTVADPAEEPRSVWVKSDGLYSGELTPAAPGDPYARELISCGTPLPGFTVTHEGDVGELHISGPSVARGYHGQPELNATRFQDGRLATGDLGFLHDGELYLVGRLDDRLIVAGRNIDVADLELEIAEDAGVRKGNCAVVDVRRGDAQRIVLVAELDTVTEPDQLLSQVREIAARRHGLRIDGVVTLEHGQFPKTPSGKAQRYRCRELAAGAAE